MLSHCSVSHNLRLPALLGWESPEGVDTSSFQGQARTGPHSARLPCRSYLTPVRDEEAESLRKARSRQARQTRRSTQVSVPPLRPCVLLCPVTTPSSHSLVTAHAAVSACATGCYLVTSSEALPPADAAKGEPKKMLWQQEEARSDPTYSQIPRRQQTGLGGQRDGRDCQWVWVPSGQRTF